VLSISIKLFCGGILLFEHQINAFKRLSLQLVYNIVQNLQASDVNHTTVVWGVRNLDLEAKHAHQKGAESRTLHKLVITFIENLSTRYFLKHSKNHFNVACYYINFLHNAVNQWVFSGQLQRVLL